MLLPFKTPSVTEAVLTEPFTEDDAVQTAADFSQKITNRLETASINDVFTAELTRSFRRLEHFLI